MHSLHGGLRAEARGTGPAGPDRQLPGGEAAEQLESRSAGGLPGTHSEAKPRVTLSIRAAAP